MKKTLISLFTLLVALCTIMLSSCSSFFEEETLMIESVKATNMDDGRTKITITYVDDVEEPLVFYIPQGPTGEQGEQGVGIEDIDYEELENGNTLITIKVTDDEIPPVQFEVQNGIKILSLKEGVDALSGEKYIFFEYNDGTYSEEIIIPSGKNGIGIKDCTTVPNDDGGYTLTIILDDEREYSVIIPGPEKGETGLGIDNKDGKKGVVGGVSADGTKYVITFYYTDGSSESVEFARPNQWHWTNGKPANSLGAVGDYCFDTTNNDIYVKDRPNSWANIFDMDSVETTHTVKFDLNAYIFNEESQTYQLSAQSLYDLGYTEGYSQGYSDADDFDFYYATRLARFHGGHYYSPWYWSHVSYIYNPWHWDPWFYDPWYRPYYYGGWYSVGWGIGYCGSYWNPYWPGYHSFYPHHHHHYWGHANIHTPRISTVRNRDYGRSRIVSRTSRVGEQGRTNRGTTLGSGQQTRRSDASSRFTERSASRSTRVTDRSQRSTTTNRSTSNTVRRNSERTNTTQQRSSSSSTMRSNSNTRMSERNNSRMGGSMGSSSRSGGMGGGTFTGGGSRSGGGSRGGGRGR